MDTDKVLRWLIISFGPIAWSIAGIYYAVLHSRQYCETRRNNKQNII